MVVSYELMDAASGNLVGSYDSEEEAHATIRHAYDAFGLSGIEDLALIRVEGDGPQELLAAGADLAYRAVDKAGIPGAPEPIAPTRRGNAA